MQESQRVTASTVLDEKETRELIERMSAEHRTTVQDLAEAMDVDVDVVAARLAQMRSEKQAQVQPPVIKPEVMQHFRFRALQRSRTLAKRITFFSLLAAFMIFAAVLLAGQTEPKGPLPAPYTSVGPAADMKSQPARTGDAQPLTTDATR